MIEKLRITASRVIVVLLFLLICFSNRLWEETVPFVAEILFLIGVFLVGIASMGRLWCSLYIAGYKTDTLITQGPYSMCRNPLYFFSFLGAVGLGFASETLLIPFLICIAFVVYYPFVIKSEEKELMRLHTCAFDSYVKNVPRFFPKVSLLQEPHEYVVKPRIFKQHIFSALWFVWVLGIFEVIEELNVLHILPTIFSIY
ncbi:MAG: isoprenylcysteine carboxylmethyltransferase family protein [Desulfatirhabdiaceae bacterium]